MELRQLRDMQAAEHQRTLDLTRDLVTRQHQGLQISEKDLYPELELNEPYSYCVGSVQVATLIPLFQTVIVDLRPLPSPQAFEARYGLTIDDFRIFLEQGRIAVRLRDDYTSFASLDFLDGILREHEPPRSNRYTHLHGNEIETNRQRAREIFPGFEPRGQSWRREYADWVQEPLFQDVFVEKFALVASYVSPVQAETIVEEALRSTNDPATAYDWLHIFSRLRVYPTMNCLDGVNFLPIRDASLLPRPLRPSGIEDHLPYEVGRALMCNLPLRLSNDVDLALVVDPAEWMSVIRSLDAALARSSPNDLPDRCSNLQRLIYDTRSQAAEMARRKESLERRFVTVSGIGIVGALSEYAPPHWKPIIGSGSAAVYQARSKIADLIVKFRKKSHVVAWFKIEQKLRQSGR